MGNSFDTAVIVSAVTSKELERHLTVLNARNIHVVMADETSYDKLKRKYTGSKHIHVHDQFVTAEGGPQPYFQYNLNEFSGAAEATQLKELFPNLKLVTSENTASISLTSLLDDLAAKEQLNKQENNYMLLNMPGSGEPLLSSLGESQFSHLARIEVATTESTLFASSEQASSIQALLMGKGFQDDSPLFISDDQDFPVVAVSHDIKADLQQRLQNLQEQLSAERKTKTSLQAELDQLRKTQNSEIQELQQTLKLKQENYTSTEAQHKKLMAQLTEQNEQLQQELSVKSREVDQFKQRVGEEKHQCEAQLTELNQKVSEAKAEIEAKTKARDEQAQLRKQSKDLAENLNAQNEQLTQDLNAQQSLNQQLKAQLEKQEQQAEEAREDARNALRLLSIRDGDLKDLQGKYAKSLEIQERQFELLDAMQQRFEQASQYLLQLDGDTSTAELLLASDDVAESNDSSDEQRVSATKKAKSHKRGKKGRGK